MHSLDHARLSARKFAQQHVFPHISAAFPIWRPRMFLSSPSMISRPAEQPTQGRVFTEPTKADGGGGRMGARRLFASASAERKLCAAKHAGQYELAG